MNDGKNLVLIFGLAVILIIIIIEVIT